MRAHLDRVVAGIGDHQSDRRPPGVEDHWPVAGDDLAGDHEIGPCTVTSFVPSGKVAST